MPSRRTLLPPLAVLRPHARRAGGTLVVWCVMLALIVYGLSGSLLTMLGSQHQHAAPGEHGKPLVSATPKGIDGIELEDFRRLSTPVHAAAHEHAHSAFERHHHDRGDSSVIALGGDPHGTDASDEGLPTATPHLLAIASALTSFVPDAPSPRWEPARLTAVAHWIADGRDRPPKG